MDNSKFLDFCKKTITLYYNAVTGNTDETEIEEKDVYVVWSCKTLQNNKALLSTTVPDGMYYEITYNGDKKEAYVDAYKKFENFVVEYPE